MVSENKINVLVVPDLFPRHEGDVQGIFLLDYLRSTELYCNNTVFVAKLAGEKKGISTEQKGATKIHRLNISSKRIPSFLKPLYYVTWFRKGLAEAKKITPVDLIHAHGSILSGTLAWRLARQANVPFVLTEHVGPFSTVTKSPWRKAWTKFIMQKADVVLCVSEHQKQEILAAGIKPKKILVSYNPVDTALFVPAKTTQETKNILFTGRLDDFKGALRTVKAFRKISTQKPEWKLTIIGDGQEYEPIKQLLENDAQLKQKVFLLGKKSKKEIAQEMQNASFFVFPSRHESFGLVVAEALSAGLPVITTNTTAPPEFVNVQSGLLVSPDDVAALEKAMIHMTEHYKEYDPIGIRNKIVSSFGFENFGKKLHNLYLSLLK